MTTEADRLAQQASERLEPAYVLLDRIAGEVLRSRPVRAPLSEANLSGLQRLLADLVADEPLAWGMGFIAAPLIVDGLERYLVWWQRQNTRVARLRLNFDPTSVDVYDYLQMDWFQLPQRGQARVAYGPYVDYSGSDMYTVTAAVPVVADGVFLGVAGADLVVGEIERRLLEVLHGATADAVIINTERRVVAANTPRWIVGSRLPTMPQAGDFREVAELPLGIGWVLALADPAAG
ncbi:cache domain-containing protein [Mycolicibacterium sarraceniae]|uniref:Cache domain-containing protein n=1 Tax=Mycolicibacterium sarraceniae TaxID=1534348 RepID=A0A7I7SK24_9MYCO|nr:cache domain-containing protein [Mycolicibacterium sarraceniae]BBY57262.1 hypothetical protein MSAR_03980 [Mycolicibacterium sarraceniae]